MKRAIFLATVAALAFGVVAPTASAQPSVFRAVLSGRDEVPITDSLARGVATFRVNEDQTELTYRLVLANIQDVTMAHIHVGAPPTSGRSWCSCSIPRTRRTVASAASWRRGP